MRRIDAHSEDGISIVVAICSLALMISMAAIALQEAVSALSHSGRQTNTKRALQAADAAIEAAAFRVQRADLGSTLKIDPLNPENLTSQNCVVSRGEVAGGIDLEPLDPLVPPDPNGRKWCPESDPEELADGATFSYRMSSLLRVGSTTCGADGTLNLDREVVGIGRAGKVTRRVHARLRAAVSLLSGAAVQSASTDQPLTMAGTARVLGDVHSNHNITGSGVHVISGRATVGEGHTVTGVTPAGASGEACQPFVLPLVEPGDSSTTHDNTQRTDDCVNTVTMLPVACKPLLTTTGGVEYDSAKRTLRVWGNGRARLNGDTYSFCSIRLEGSGILQVRSTTPTTRIFLDAPENCTSAGSSAGRITADGQGRIVNCHAQTAPQTLQLYAVGSDSTATTQTLAGAGLVSSALRTVLCGVSLPIVGEPITVYAPRSTVELGGGTAIAGQVAADVVHMSGVSSVNPVNALVNLDQLGSDPVLPLYHATEYLECSGRDFDEVPEADPAQGC